jgi:transcriptional regulator of acetoin/glycerol metabolism
MRDGGQIEYLKTFRLSAAQTRRAFLLSKLASQNWNIDATAALLGHTRDELIRRLEKAGFGYLLAAHVLQAARRRR